MSMMSLASLGLTGLGGVLEFIRNSQDRAEWQRRTDEALDMTKQYMDSGVNAVQGISGAMAPLYGKLADGYSELNQRTAEGVATGYDALKGKYANLESTINAGYGDRTSQAMAMLEGLGQQETADTKQQFANVDSAQQQGLVSKGVGNTTLSASIKSGTARQERSALSRLNERLQNQRLDTFGTMTGDALNAKSRLGQGRIELGDRAIGAVADARTEAADSSYAAQSDALANSERLAMMPLEEIRGWVDRYVSTSQGMGLPPEVISPLTQMGQQAGGFAAAKLSRPKTPKPGLFNFNLGATL